MTEPTCINDVLPYYANDSDYQRHDRITAALEAAGFTLEMVPTERGDGTWPKWCRDGMVFISDRDALTLPLTPAVLRKARKASRSRAI